MNDPDYMVFGRERDGMPGLAVLGAAPREPGRLLGFWLAEDAHGRPLGYDLMGWPGDFHIRENVRPASFGRELVQGWLDGSALGKYLKGPLGDHGCVRPLPADIGERAAAWLGLAGFSGSFVDMVMTVASTGTHRLREAEFEQLCGKGGPAVAARRLMAGNPFVGFLHGREIGGWAMQGEEPDVGRLGYAPSVLRALAEPAWSPVPAGGPSPSRAVGMRDRECDTLATMLRELPRDWLPRDREGVDAYHAAARLLAGKRAVGSRVATLAASCRGDWPAFVARCGAVSGGNGRFTPDEYGRVPYLSDPADHLSAKVVLPLMAQMEEASGRDDIVWNVTRSRQAARDLIYGRKSLPAVYEAADRWHALLARIERALPSDADAEGNGWPALLPPATVGGMALRCLTTGRQLVDEGGHGQDADGHDGLDHCVGSYRAAAYAGHCHIVSIRVKAADGPGARLATAEVLQDRDGRTEVVQLRGRRNGHPPEGCADALATYLSRRIPYLPPREETPDDIRASCGYDWRAPGNVDAAVRAYAPMLPRWARGGARAIMDWYAAGDEPSGRSPGP